MRNIKKFVGALSIALLTIVFSCGVFSGCGKNTRGQNTAVGGSEQTNAGGESVRSQEMAAYMFVHFVGTEGSYNDEQAYFSVSRDGTNWSTLNQGNPIAVSDVGEKGIRDPHIIRKHDGTGFYMIATDLSIHHGHLSSYNPDRKGGGDSWGSSQTAGSEYIVVWESSDLVHWGTPRWCKVARANATCTWAPESIYDEQKQAYMVFWASKTKEDWIHRLYRCYTTDFVTFTEPEVYIEEEESRIDTTFIKEGDTYYRFTKDEHRTYVYVEKSKSLDGPFTAVNTFAINGQSGSAYTGYEGPTVYKLNGQNKWCMLLDNYGTGSGYKPFVTEDIATCRFTSAPAFNFGGTKFRHGTVMPITLDEYNALTAAYPVDGGEEESGELVYSMDFEDNLTATGNGLATASGSISYDTGVNGGKAVRISGSGNYITIGKNAENANFMVGLESMSVSFAVKASGKSWLFFASPNANKQTYMSEKYLGVLWNNNGLECERYNSNNQNRPSAVTGTLQGDEWHHITMVYRKDATVLYVDGTRMGKVNSSVNINALFGSDPIIQLGKANWENGEYSDCVIDALRIHNYAMSEADVVANYNTVMGLA